MKEITKNERKMRALSYFMSYFHIFTPIYLWRYEGPKVAIGFIFPETFLNVSVTLSADLVAWYEVLTFFMSFLTTPSSLITKSAKLTRIMGVRDREILNFSNLWGLQVSAQFQNLRAWCPSQTRFDTWKNIWYTILNKLTVIIQNFYL